MSSELFVGNLNPEVRIRDLENVFGRYGRIVRCDLKKNFGFVQFEDRRDAEEAIKKEDNRRLLGSEMTVEWAKGSVGDKPGFGDGPPGGFRKPRSPTRFGGGGRGRPRSPFGGGHAGRGRGRDRSPVERNGFSGPPRFSPRGPPRDRFDSGGGRGRRSFDVGNRDSFDSGSRVTSNRGPTRDRFTPRDRFNGNDGGNDRFSDSRSRRPPSRGPPHRAPPMSDRSNRGPPRDNDFNSRPPRGDRANDRRDSFSSRPSSNFRGPRRF